ncbi:MAG: cytochrome P450 [Porticoccaceae bacterium]|nr:MAG: cytochrome P450 [Porticoccaceae bacterium]
MVALADLELPWLPVSDAAFAADPWPHFAAARAEHPWLARCAHGYLVHGHRQARELLRRDDDLVPALADLAATLGALDTDWGRFQRMHLQSRTGADHRRLRGIVAPFFSPAAARAQRGLMARTMVRLLDQWAPRGAFDFEEFVSWYPISVMSAILGAPLEAIPTLRSSLEALGLAFGMDPDFMPRVEEGYQVLERHVRELWEDRCAQRGRDDDLLGHLVHAVAEGRLSEREAWDFLIFAYVGGYDTSKNAMTILMSLLLERPAMYARCAEDLAYCGRVMEEGFRYFTTATIPRRVVRPFEYEGINFPEGALLLFPVSVTGRDPAVCPRPDEFDPDRQLDPEAHHLAFGRGAHICLGQFIARNQIEVGLYLIARRLANPRRTGPSEWRPFMGVWGLRGLPIAFEDRGAPSGDQIPAVA